MSLVPVGGVPTGVITMWSGSVGNIPSGWTLCDGTNVNGESVPDLTDRFVVGAGGSYTEGQTGGEDSVSLTDSEMPSHRHADGNYSTDSDGYHSHNVSGNTDTTGEHTHTGDIGGSYDNNQNSIDKVYTNTNGGDTLTNPAGDHSHNVSGNTNGTGDHSHGVTGHSSYSGSGSAHENRPSFYATAFIMKV
jgi:microcystin-dependent protein